MQQYYAFISYNHKDAKTAQWLHRKLESYLIPAEAHNELDAQQKYLRPVFRDKDELNTGILNNELHDKLVASRYLVVICSPHSARSAWVSKEIQTFIDLGRLEDIIPLIVDGTPHSYDDAHLAEPLDDECFPEALRRYTHDHPDQELLGVSIPEVGKEKAFVRIVSKMLGVGFDTLWNRQKRLLRRKRILTAVGVVTVFLALLGVGLAVRAKNMPVDIEYSLVEQTVHNDQLPEIKDIAVTMMLDNESKTDTVALLSDVSQFTNIPAAYLGREVAFHIEAAACCVCDTTIVLTEHIELPIVRNEAFYGHIDRMLYSVNREKPLAGRHLQVLGRDITTGADGRFVMDIPLQEQAAQYKVTSSDVVLVDDVIYVPSSDGSLILAE